MNVLENTHAPLKLSEKVLQLALEDHPGQSATCIEFLFAPGLVFMHIQMRGYPGAHRLGKIHSLHQSTYPSNRGSACLDITHRNSQYVDQQLRHNMPADDCRVRATPNIAQSHTP